MVEIEEKRCICDTDQVDEEDEWLSPLVLHPNEQLLQELQYYFTETEQVIFSSLLA